MKNWGLRRIKWLARGHTARKQQNRKFSLIPDSRAYTLDQYPMWNTIVFPTSNHFLHFHHTFTLPSLLPFAPLWKSFKAPSNFGCFSHLVGPVRFSQSLWICPTFPQLCVELPSGMSSHFRTATQNPRNTSKSYCQLNCPHSPPLRLFFAKDLTLYLNVLIIYCDI